MKLHDTMIDLEGMLIEHVSRVSFGHLPEEVVACCKLLIIDSLGVTFPGSRAPGCQEIVDLARTWETAVGSRVFIYGYKVAPPLAALVNSTMMHALDFDDTLDTSALHTFVTVLPAALATAEFIGGVDGKSLITALVLGVDMVCRLSLGIRRPLSWIRTATCGSFGAAAAAGKVLGLSSEELGHALGIAYSQTSGNAQGLMERRLAKRMQPGFAAQAGVQSAFFAKAGITGSRDFLQGKYGFYRLYEGGEYDPVPVVDRLGEHYTILDLSLKPYPCCRMTHASIDAALQLRDEAKGFLNLVEEIEVVTSRMVADMVGKPFVTGSDPQVDAQFSIPYTVSCALIRGHVFLEDFELDHIMDEKVNAMARRVRVVADPALGEKDILHASMTIRTKDGRRSKAVIGAPLGNPANPLGLARCREKFTKCLEFSRIEYDVDRSHELLSTIESLEHVKDVGLLAAAMGP